MNVTNSEVQPNASAASTTGDSAKLLSLLALASGAVAMPQTSNADIVFVDLSASPVHIGELAVHDYVINTLPGNAQIGFHTHHQVATTSVNSSRWITVKQELAAGYVRLLTKATHGGFILMRANAGQTWSQIKNQAGVAVSKFGTAGFNNFVAGVPGAYPGSFPGDKYYMFEFKDSTQGNAMRYGWLWVGLANPAAGSLDLAINGYAYDTTGVRLGAGQVPEPSAPALLALGALVFGSKGLRSWRKNRKTEPTPVPSDPV
jgi:hypothetical protein